MGDHDDLGRLAQFGQQPIETVDIGFIQRGVDLVEQAERAGFDQIKGENQGNGHQGLFSAGQKAHDRQFFPRRMDMDFDAGFQQVRFIGQGEPCFSPLE